MVCGVCWWVLCLSCVVSMGVVPVDVLASV